MFVESLTKMKCLFNFKFKKKREMQMQKSAVPICNDDSKSTAENISMSTDKKKSQKNLRVFSYGELVEATDNFSRQLKIGEGIFGSVYKGTIKLLHKEGDDESTLVAIKRLNKDGFQTDCFILIKNRKKKRGLFSFWRRCFDCVDEQENITIHQGHKQWVAEVQLLGILEHQHLVKLIGYCAVYAERGIQRLLVYEFVPNKSLEDHLFNRAYPVLSWASRLQIALGAAQGVAFLHEESEVQVTHRNFKTSNVLLDEDFMPKLSDFGLTRDAPTGANRHVSTVAVGGRTSGYVGPDYIETGHLTSKSDVWSFGVVLYEILTGRRSLERNRPRSEQKLLEWIKDYPANSKNFGRIMDPRLENHYSLGAARAIAKLADSCLLKSAKDRPKMSQVVETLKQIINLSDTPKAIEEAYQSMEDLHDLILPIAIVENLPLPLPLPRVIEEAESFEKENDALSYLRLQI